MVAQLALLWVGSVALACMFGGLVVSVPAYKRGEGSLAGVFGFGFGLLFWALFALHSNGYTIAVDAGQISMATRSFTIAGVIGALVCLVLLFDAAMRSIGNNA